jgi:hypothetical protein
MTKRMQKKVFHGLRLVAAAVAAVLVILAVAMASGMLVADEAMGAATDELTIFCSNPANANSPLCLGASGGGAAAVDNTAQNILHAIMWFGVAIAILFIVIGGLQMMMANGDQTKAVKGRNTMVFAVLGLVIALLARVITDIVFAQFT